MVKVVAPHPRAILESLEEVEEEDPITLVITNTCDVCNSEPDDAVSFCVECGKKMCEKHESVSCV